MRLIAKCKDIVVNIRFDSYEKEGDVVTIYNQLPIPQAPEVFVGRFNLSEMDYLYITEERQK